MFRFDISKILPLYKCTKQTKFGIHSTCVRLAKEATDPIQKLFIISLRAYAKKLQESGGKMFDPDPDLEKILTTEMAFLKKKYFGGKDINIEEFPKNFNFAEVKLDSIDMVSGKDEKK